MYLAVVFGFFSSIFFTLLVRRFAEKNLVLDHPDQTRKFHHKNIPLLGGVALFISFWLPVGYILFFNPVFGIELIKNKLLAAFFGSFILILIGIADDIKGLSARFRLVATAGAIALTVYLGIGLPKITNPLGGVIYLSELFGGVLVFIWLLGMTYTTKITDGLDGLATGIVAIGSFMLFLLSSLTKYYQPNVAWLCLVFFGVCLGFLIFNFHPASIFLGESGSLFIGFLLGVLAVISGGKVAIALLAVAIPVLDLARVIIIRWREGVPIFSGDRRHLHFLLVDLGISPVIVTLSYYLVAISFGFLALYLSSFPKIIILFLLILVMVFLNQILPEKNIYDHKK
ncbi:MAG: MraY family glycosyltransferase [Patescibacteria group bacterium]|jgi:UDP-GlcNAc:undecaprenyl-phosphate GlcNAc-1-phosphate transferase